jgi:hypothetical protein
VHAAVWVAAAATFAAAVTVGQFRQTETGATIENLLLVRGEPEALKEIAAAYVEASLGLDDAALAALARDHAAAYTPEMLNRMGLHLISDRANREAGRAGVFLLAAGADLYRSPLLLERAGWQFYLARFVERDFEKATLYLSDPRVRYRAATVFRLGRVLIDARNPNRDVAAGAALVRSAAKSGNELAIAWLERTGELEEEENSEE